MKRAVFFAFALFFSQPAQAQISRNTTLIGNLNYGRFTNDVWGYTDANGNDYAIVGLIDGVSVVRVTPQGLQEVRFIAGTNSIWRDIKTHEHYAYITADQGTDGLTILDLSGLPASVRLVGMDRSSVFTAHNLYIDNGFAYLAGSNQARGADILDLANPEAPVKVGAWSEHYFHDIIVQDDILYGSAGGSSSIVVLDISDKTRPTLITEIPFPDRGYAHNAWISPDGRYLMTTQETRNLTVKMWDISDLLNPEIVDEYLSMPSSIAHNTHIRGDYAFISHYGDGLRILDISDPSLIVEVGYYDTFPNNTTALFEGNWGAFPFTSSGYVYASDENFGLFVVNFNNRQGSRLRGVVRDVDTGLAITGVELEVLETGAKTDVEGDGTYKLGFAEPGTYNIRAQSLFYDSETVTVEVFEGELVERAIDLRKTPLGEVAGQVVDEDDNGLSNTQIRFGDPTLGLIVTDAEGHFRIQGLPAGSYSAVVGRWGFRVANTEIIVEANQISNQEIVLQKGVHDNFELDLDWERRDDFNNFEGPWRIVDPSEIGIGEPFHPAEDVTPPPGVNAYYARVLGSRISLISPLFDLTGMTNASIKYYQYWFPRGQNNDSLLVDISNDDGVSWLRLAGFGDADELTAWNEIMLAIPESFQLTAQMRVRFLSREETGVSSFALIDEFEVVSTVTSVPATGPSVPGSFVLDQNYPNPFNAGTTIRYSIPERAEISLRIYNIIGEEVRLLFSGVQGEGQHQIHWDGIDNAGQAASSGIYFYKFEAPGYSQTRQMVFIQ